MSKTMQLEQKLERYFQYDQFRKGQREIIEDVLQAKNVLGVLPTGSGKSICYQLPSLLMDGLTIVVSPLISLMIDQVKELRAKNFKRVVALNSLVGYEERQFIYQHLNQYKLLYISPELLQQEQFIKKLSSIKISLFVIDEAHCISQWGHDFRPDYLKLGAIIKQLESPPVLALSATAAPAVQEDIIENLHLKTITKHIYPMDRKNLTFIIEKVSTIHEKIELMTTYLGKHLGPALIYFSSRIQAENMVETLRRMMPSLKVAFYHGGIDPVDRIQIQQQFMNDQLDVICCTSAFGMGINKSNIRLIIHFHIPSQIEAYIQEVGRAGRDGKPSICLLLFGVGDIAIPKNIIENELPHEDEIRVVMQQLKQMGEEGLELPVRDLELYERFQISETKWRFLRFHFEKHGMIMAKNIVYDPIQWQRVFRQLNKWIQSRNSYKKQELEEMIDLVETTACLRETIYKKFQKGYSTPIFQCCSNCGIDLSKWAPSVKPARDEEIPWKDKLRKLLVGGI